MFPQNFLFWPLVSKCTVLPSIIKTFNVSGFHDGKWSEKKQNKRRAPGQVHSSNHSKIIVGIRKAKIPDRNTQLKTYCDSDLVFFCQQENYWGGVLDPSSEPSPLELPFLFQDRWDGVQIFIIILFQIKTWMVIPVSVYYSTLWNHETPNLSTTGAPSSLHILYSSTPVACHEPEQAKQIPNMNLKSKYFAV